MAKQRKQQVQKLGVRPWAGDEFESYINDPLAGLDAFFKQYGACVVQGLELSAAGDNFDVSEGYVALGGTDPENNDVFMIVPFAGTQNTVLPLYLTLQATVQERQYSDGGLKPITYSYEAAASNVQPTDKPYLEISQSGTLRFADAIQDPTHRFVSDALITAWNAKETTTGAQAKADAALAAAKVYTDSKTAGVANKAYVDTQDAEGLTAAKTYTDQSVEGLVHESELDSSAFDGNAKKLNGNTDKEIMPRVGYMGALGVLVKTTVSSTMTFLTGKLILNSYGLRVPTEITLQLYNYQSDEIINVAAVSGGLPVELINVFIYKSFVHIWFPSPDRYCPIVGGLYTVDDDKNVIDSYTTSAMPTAGVSNLVTITPTQAAFQPDYTASGEQRVTGEFWAGADNVKRQVYCQRFRGLTASFASGESVTRLINSGVRDAYPVMLETNNNSGVKNTNQNAFLRISSGGALDLVTTAAAESGFGYSVVVKYTKTS